MKHEEQETSKREQEKDGGWFGFAKSSSDRHGVSMDDGEVGMSDYADTDWLYKVVIAIYSVLVLSHTDQSHFALWISEPMDVDGLMYSFLEFCIIDQ